MNIQLRYCSMWNYEPRAVSLTEKILTKYKQQIKGFELVPDGGGCFEVSVNGKLVYSKLETGEYPDEESFVTELEQYA